jgi:hypothetical protein
MYTLQSVLVLFRLQTFNSFHSRRYFNITNLIGSWYYFTLLFSVLSASNTDLLKHILYHHGLSQHFCCLRRVLLSAILWHVCLILQLTANTRSTCVDDVVLGFVDSQIDANISEKHVVPVFSIILAALRSSDLAFGYLRWTWIFFLRSPDGHEPSTSGRLQNRSPSTILGTQHVCVHVMPECDCTDSTFARRTSYLAKIFRGSPQSFEANAGLRPLSKPL